MPDVGIRFLQWHGYGLPHQSADWFAMTVFLKKTEESS